MDVDKLVNSSNKCATISFYFISAMKELLFFAFGCCMMYSIVPFHFPQVVFIFRNEIFKFMNIFFPFSFINSIADMRKCPLIKMNIEHE